MKFTERQIAEYWERGWKRLLHNAWRILGVSHPLSSRIGRRFLAAGRRSVAARAEEKAAAAVDTHREQLHAHYRKHGIE